MAFGPHFFRLLGSLQPTIALTHYAAPISGVTDRKVLCEQLHQSIVKLAALASSPHRSEEEKAAEFLRNAQVHSASPGHVQGQFAFTSDSNKGAR